MTQPTTLAQLFAEIDASTPAVITTSPPAVVTYRALSEQVDQLEGQLSRAGLHRGDCVAIVLPNGLEFIVAFFALARAGLVVAPMNPAYKPSELRVLFEDMQPNAIIAEDSNSAVVEATAGRPVPIWRSSTDGTGAVGLTGLPRLSRSEPGNPSAGDVALLLHTSGTTNRPKAVPLTHANVLSSVLNIASHYKLTSADRSLVVLPLFHGHGLVGAMLATFASGGAVIVPPRFSASQFWGLFRKHDATWFTAVPTIHQILLARADADGAPDRGPRFIRSCSETLAPAVSADLEQRFGAPVLEAYGMTETAHQVASNPLPPHRRKSETVGFATGDEIAIINDRGAHLPANSHGEVVLRGPNVMRGYRNNPDANASAFIDGWFRTGDTGVLDEDGYLTLTGRIKELINRGGEKIAPSEVEDVLLEHPAVAEAAVLGMPDPKYGEAVFAAVVLKGDTDADELQSFCKARLADFKVPAVIRIMPALPKNAVGKVDLR
ncbi:MAG: Peroxisomalcoenzyme synthetase, partial [Actinomycetia bacterium]|nr:Peroxisomalcoenzyme synthetase [Actinomycetes bacterium]